MDSFWSFAQRVSSIAEAVSSEIAQVSGEILRDTEASSKGQEETEEEAKEEVSKGETEEKLGEALTEFPLLTLRKSKAVLKNLYSTIQPHLRDVPQFLYSTLFSPTKSLWKITDRIYIMRFPDIEKRDSLSETLNKLHPNHYMIFNMSEKSYDTTTYFSLGQVIEVHFKGLPAPPLQLQQLLCIQANNWLLSDRDNVLVVHCFSGFGRTIIFLSCFMAWCGIVDHPLIALMELCEKLDLSDQFLGHIIPSQRRYIGYFDSISSGYAPSFRKLVLKRLILKGIPHYGLDMLPIESHEMALDGHSTYVFRPFVEVWHNSVLVYSSLKKQRNDGVDEYDLSEGHKLKEYTSLDEEMVMEMDVLLYGDVLLRLRTVDTRGSQETVLRVAFHTGFIADFFALYKKHELDGAAVDPCFPDDCLLSLFFDDAGLMDPQKVQEEVEIFAKSRQHSREAKNALREVDHYISSSMKDLASSQPADVSSELHQIATKKFQQPQDPLFSTTADEPREAVSNVEMSLDSYQKLQLVSAATEEPIAAPNLILSPTHVLEAISGTQGVVPETESEKPLFSGALGKEQAEQREATDSYEEEILREPEKAPLAMNVIPEEDLDDIDELNLGWGVKSTPAIPTLQQWRPSTEKNRTE